MDVQFQDRLSYRQAKQTVWVAIVIGLILSSIQIAVDLVNENRQMDIVVSEIAGMFLGSAENAAYNMDSGLANKIVHGFMYYGPICKVVIVDENNKPLSSAEKKIPESGMRAFMDHVIEKHKQFSFPLFQERHMKIGTMNITVDRYLMAGNFLKRSWILVTGGMVRNILLAVILTLIFYKTLTRPLLRIVANLKRVDPEHPANGRIDTIAGHEKDEMGLLVHTVNRLLINFDESLVHRHAAEKALRESEQNYRLLSAKLEEEVERKTKEINDTQSQMMHQEKMASIGHLAAGVAHEINNPMGFITSNLKTLKTYTGDMITALNGCIGFINEEKTAAPDTDRNRMPGSSLEELLDNIKALDIEYLIEDIPQLLNESLEGADRINQIVRDLKDFAHPGQENPAYADLEHCIETTLNIVWNELKYKVNIIRTYTKVPRILCYPRQLNQVIMNLLVNSAHAIENKGDIEIMTRDCGDFVEMAFRDTGCGIPEENIPRIFNAFFTTKEAGKGTGLGLNLVYTIINKHQGTIDVKSRVGEGTVFTVRLPVNPDLG